MNSKSTRLLLDAKRCVKWIVCWLRDILIRSIGYGFVTKKIFQNSNQRYKIDQSKVSNTEWLKARMQHRYKS